MAQLVRAPPCHQKAIEKINETVGTQIRTQVYDNIPDMVQALYEGSADAMLMNVAYVDVVKAQDGCQRRG